MSKRAAGLLLCLLAGAVRGEPAAWVVADAEGGALWLLGSVHYLRREDYPLPSRIDALYQQADAIVMELDLDDLDPLAAQGAFASAGMLSAGQSLETVLAPEVYTLARNRAAEYGLDLTLMTGFEPWLLAITMMDLGMNAIGFEAGRGLEQYLLRRAADDGKEILGLETLEDQIDVFEALSFSEQEALLLQTIGELDSAEDSMDELLLAWRNGRLDTLAEKLGGDFEDFPGLYRRLVTDRNRRWLEEIRRLSGEGKKYLVVVGALHLVGEHSVIELLEEAGIPVAKLR